MRSTILKKLKTGLILSLVVSTLILVAFMFRESFGPVYSYMLGTKTEGVVDSIVNDMEDASISLIDILVSHKK